MRPPLLYPSVTHSEPVATVSSGREICLEFAKYYKL
jgi:hypothetical protein